MMVRKGVVGGYAFDDMPSFEEHTASSSTLYDELMEQFHWNSRQMESDLAGEFIIASLDDSGFWIHPSKKSQWKQTPTWMMWKEPFSSFESWNPSDAVRRI